MEFLSALIHFDRTLDVAMHQYGTAVYLLLFLIVFFETALLALFFLPGDPLLFISGALCAGGELDIGILMALLYVAAVTGSALNYRIGQSLGKASKSCILDSQALAEASGASGAGAIKRLTISVILLTLCIV